MTLDAYVHVATADKQYENACYVKLKGAGDAAKIVVNLPVENIGSTTYSVKIFVPGVGNSDSIDAFRNGANYYTAVFTNGDLTETLDIKLPAGLRTLSGVIKVGNDGGANVENAWVSITKKGAPFGKVTKTDANGAYRLDIPDGDYVLTVDHPNFLSKPPVNVTVSNNTTKALYLEALATDAAAFVEISGILYKDSVADANKISAGIVGAVDATGRFAKGDVNADGTYSIKVPNVNATWYVEARADGFETLGVNKTLVDITLGNSAVNQNVLLTKIKVNGQEYQVKPPEVAAVTLLKAVWWTIPKPKSRSRFRPMPWVTLRMWVKLPPMIPKITSSKGK